MKLFTRFNIISVSLLVITLMTACERTELCYDHYPKASIAFDFEKEWERDYGASHHTQWDAASFGYDYESLRPNTPEWINLIRYKDGVNDGEHYFSPNGGDIKFTEEGTHSFLFYNGDTEYIVLEDIASLPNARALATPRSRSSISYIMERHSESRTTNPPDILYASYLETTPSIKPHDVTALNVHMRPLVYTYVVRYEFEYGLQHVHLARGALAGMAESVYLRTGNTSDESTIILYDCELKSYGCEAQVRSFGIPGFPDDYYNRSDVIEDRPYTLNLELMLTNGNVVEFNYDVADQLKKQPRGGVIKISGIRVEDDMNEPTGGGGFDVGLSGWNDVEQDLPM